MIRRLVGLLTGVVAAPIAFVGFAMGLMVAEPVIYPTVALVTALITGLVASWLADGLAGDGWGTDMNAVIRRNLAWGLVPALAAPAYFWLGFLLPPVFLLATILIWTAITATRFAFRYRGDGHPGGEASGSIYGLATRSCPGNHGDCLRRLTPWAHGSMTYGDVHRAEDSTLTDSAYSRSTVLVEERLIEEVPTFGDNSAQSAFAERCGRCREGGNGK